MTERIWGDWRKLVGLLVLVLFPVVSGSGAAAASLPGLSFQTSTPTVQEGESFTVTLYAEELAGNLMGFHGVIDFDPAMVRLEKPKQEDADLLLSPFLIYFVESDAEQGWVEINAVRDGGPSPRQGGVLFTLHFQALRPGQFSLVYQEVKLRNKENRPLDFVGGVPLVISIISKDDKAPAPATGTEQEETRATNGNEVEETTMEETTMEETGGTNGNEVEETTMEETSGINGTGVEETANEETGGGNGTGAVWYAPGLSPGPEQPGTGESAGQQPVGGQAALPQPAEQDAGPEPPGPKPSPSSGPSTNPTPGPSLKPNSGPSAGPGTPPVLVELRLGETGALANNRELVLDAVPFIKDGRTFVPLRFVGESLGAAVAWEDQERKVLITRGEVQLELSPDSKVLVRGGEQIQMDVAPALVPPGRVMVPVRFVSQAMGAEVGWDEKENRVTISLGF